MEPNIAHTEAPVDVDRATDPADAASPRAVLDTCYAPRFGMARAPASADPVVTASRQKSWDVTVSPTTVPGAACATFLVTLRRRGTSRGCAAQPWSLDDATRDFARGVFGPEWFEVSAVGPAVVTALPIPAPDAADPCTPPTYHALLRFPIAGVYAVYADVLFEKYDHLADTAEDAPITYATTLTTERIATGSTLEVATCSSSGSVDRDAAAGGVWMERAPDAENYKKGRLGGYWLKVKGEAVNAAERSFRRDILGRMNYGAVYHRAAIPGAKAPSPVCAHVAGKVVPPPCDRACLLRKLRGKTIYFAGDSHIRILFYGFLDRLGVAFPADKVWRGDRTDHVASHNVTVKFIASYFLNLTRPSAQQMLNDRSEPVIVTGVGQHHSCHCWTVPKHMSVVREALDTLLAPDAAKRRVLWFGVPAQPVNRHLHMPKPVGQARRDCRNNARHLVYSAHQAAETYRRGVPFIDALGPGVGMAHTSLDGAHFYTWVRDAWIDRIGQLLG